MKVRLPSCTSCKLHYRCCHHALAVSCTSCAVPADMQEADTAESTLTLIARFHQLLRRRCCYPPTLVTLVVAHRLLYALCRRLRLRVQGLLGRSSTKATLTCTLAGGQPTQGKGPTRAGARERACWCVERCVSFWVRKYYLISQLHTSKLLHEGAPYSCMREIMAD